MLDYLADKAGSQALSDAADVITDAIHSGFFQNTIRPAEFGGDMGTRAVTQEIIRQINS